MCAAQHGNIHALQTLLDYGSEIDACDGEGDTPISYAIAYLRKNALLLLLEKGANYKLVNRVAWTILHFAAFYGSIRMIEILRVASMVDIDPYAKNKDGKTAFELAQQHKGKLGDFIDLFLTMLSEIRNRNDYLARQRGDSTDTVVEEIDGDNDQNQGGSATTAESVRVPGAWPQK